MSKKDEDRDWSSATWEGAEEATLKDGMKMSLADKLRWLEQMQAFTDRIAGKATVREERRGYPNKGT